MQRPSLQSTAEPFLRRARQRAMGHGAVDGIIVGATLAGCALASWRLWDVGGTLIAGVGFALSVTVGVLAARWRLPSEPQLLSSLDADLSLRARVRTAWESAARDTPTPLVEAQIRDAVASLSACAPREWIPRLLPRRTWVTPVCVGLAAATLLIPSRGEAEPELTAPQREAITQAAQALSGDAALARRLREAETMDEALAALADVEERVETQTKKHDQSQRALDTVRATLRDAANSASPADALRDVEATSYPELQAQLRELRDKLARNATTAGLAHALEGIETRDVTEATLRKIVAELAKLEDAASAGTMASLDEIRKQKRAVALAAVDAQTGGTNARTDGVAGTETGDLVAQGSRLGDVAAAAETANAMLLESLESSSLRERRVRTRRRGANGPAVEAELMPFREAVANARASVAYAVANNDLPVAYRDRIRRYFDALQQIAEEDTP